jgi:hypothetical protein
MKTTAWTVSCLVIVMVSMVSLSFAVVSDLSRDVEFQPFYDRINQLSRSEREAAMARVDPKYLTDFAAWVLERDTRSSTSGALPVNPASRAAFQARRLRASDPNWPSSSGVSTQTLVADTVILQTLNEFYVNTNGASWFINTNWATGASYCDWHGVVCDSSTPRQVLYLYPLFSVLLSGHRSMFLPFCLVAFLNPLGFCLRTICVVPFPIRWVA